MLGACHSLAEAHEHGVVHRDIKPANLVACRYGLDLDLIKVLDFGLVALSSRDDEDTSLTAANTVLGTPAFMAPESARGQEVDHRADLYALGCVIYWLIAGRLVFQEDTAMGLAIAHATKAPPRLEDICDADVPAELSDLLMSCLAKNPDDRPQDAEELGRLLAQVPLANTWTPERAREWWTAKEPRATKDSAAKALSAAV